MNVSASTLLHVAEVLVFVCVCVCMSLVVGETIQTTCSLSSFQRNCQSEGRHENKPITAAKF